MKKNYILPQIHSMTFTTEGLFASSPLSLGVHNFESTTVYRQEEVLSGKKSESGTTFWESLE